MTRTVLLDCPIKAEIKAVDSQSDLTILLKLWLLLLLLLLFTLLIIIVIVMYTYTQFWWSTRKKFPLCVLQLVTAGHKGLAIFHISRTLCGILAVPSNGVFCTCPGLTLTNILKRLIQDLPRIQLSANWYGNVNYFTDSILLPQNYNIWSSSLCFVVALYVKSHNTSILSVSNTLWGWCSYHLSAQFIPFSPHNSQWIILATLSCLFVYSVCASLVHSLMTWLTLSPLSWRILQNADSILLSTGNFT